MPSARPAVALLLVLGLGLAGCAGGGSGSSGATATSGPSVPSPGGGCDVRGATFKRESSVGSESSLIDTAEVANEGCTDRIEFDFTSLGANLPPKYVVEYGPGPFNDVNQLYEVDVAGTVDLVIRFDQVSANNLDGDLNYRSLESIQPGNLHHLAELRMVLAPEGSVMFVAGLDSERPFTVDGASASGDVPSRVIVTIG